MIATENLPPPESDGFVNTYRQRFVEEDDSFQQALEEWHRTFALERERNRKRIIREEFMHRQICGERSVTPHQEDYDKMQAAADEGRELIERDMDSLDSLLIAPAVDQFLSETVPNRIQNLAAAGAVLQSIRAAGCRAFVQHGAVRVDRMDLLPSSLIAELCKLNGEIGDILDMEGSMA